MIYYIEKEGVCFHGVFWIGINLEKGKKMVDKFARSDVDDYHSWVLKKYIPFKFKKDDINSDFRGKTIYSTTKDVVKK